MKTFKEAWKKIKDMPGLVEENEMEALFNAIREFDAKKIVEIGCLYGKSTAIIAEAAAKDAEIITIDNFSVQGEDARKYLVENILPVYPSIKLLELSSNDAVNEVFVPIDFIFIDGNHFDDGIKADCENWLPKLKSFGIAAFHDYFNDLFPMVRERVEASTFDWRLINQAGSLIIKQKP